MPDQKTYTKLIKNTIRELRDSPAKLRKFLTSFSRKLGYQPVPSGQWTVLWPAGRDKKRRIVWFGICECGLAKTAPLRSFQQGQPKLCTHGLTQPKAIQPLEKGGDKVILPWGWAATQARMLRPSLVIMVVEFQRGERGPEDTIPTMYARYHLAQARWLDTIPTKISEDQLREICQGLLDDSDTAEPLPFGQEQGDWLYTVRGRTRSLNEWARRAKKDIQEMLERLDTMPVAEALVIGPVEEPIRIGSQQMTPTEWLKRIHLSRAAYTQRLNAGWSQDWALITPKEIIPLKMPIKVGEEVHTVEEWAEIYQATPKEILRRLPEGLQLWSRVELNPNLPLGKAAEVRVLGRRSSMIQTQPAPVVRRFSAPRRRPSRLK